MEVKLNSWIKAGAWLFGVALAIGALWGQEEDAEDEVELDEAPFREALYLSELQQDRGYAQAVRVGGVLFVSATTSPVGDYETQLRTIYRRLQSVLGQHGMTMGNVAQERIYTLDMAALERSLETRRAFYPEARVPAVSWVEVKALADSGALLAVELMAVAED